MAFADELRVPISCYPTKLQAKFAEKGYKLDLSANDRDKNSCGFLESKGSSYSIFTYKQVTSKELEMIMRLTMER